MLQKDHDGLAQAATTAMSLNTASTKPGATFTIRPFLEQRTRNQTTAKSIPLLDRIRFSSSTAVGKALHRASGLQIPPYSKMPLWWGGLRAVESYQFNSNPLQECRQCLQSMGLKHLANGGPSAHLQSACKVSAAFPNTASSVPRSPGSLPENAQTSVRVPNFVGACRLRGGHHHHHHHHHHRHQMPHHHHHHQPPPPQQVPPPPCHLPNTCSCTIILDIISYIIYLSILLILINLSKMMPTPPPNALPTPPPPPPAPIIIIIIILIVSIIRWDRDGSGSGLGHVWILYLLKL